MRVDMVTIGDDDDEDVGVDMDLETDGSGGLSVWDDDILDVVEDWSSVVSSGDDMLSVLPSPFFALCLDVGGDIREK